MKNSKKVMIVLLTLMVVLNMFYVSKVVKASGNNSIQKHHAIEEITYCISSTGLDDGLYISTLINENDIEYIIYSEENLTEKWFVLIIDNKANDNVYDNEVLDMYDLDSYDFNN